MKKTNTFKFIKFFISLKVLILELVVVFICIVKKGSSERKGLFFISTIGSNWLTIIRCLQQALLFLF